MNQSLDLKALWPAITKFFRRYHGIMFFSIISIGLIVAIFFVINIISSSSTVDNTLVNSVDRGFDQVTIDRLSELKSDNNSEKLTIPSGVRTNPFQD